MTGSWRNAAAKKVLFSTLVDANNHDIFLQVCHTSPSHRVIVDAFLTENGVGNFDGNLDLRLQAFQRMNPESFVERRRHVFGNLNPFAFEFLSNIRIVVKRVLLSATPLLPVIWMNLNKMFDKRMESLLLLVSMLLQLMVSILLLLLLLFHWRWRMECHRAAATAARNNNNNNNHQPPPTTTTTTASPPPGYNLRLDEAVVSVN